MPSRYRMPPASRIISCSAPLRATSATNKMRHRLSLQDRARPDGQAVLLTYCQNPRTVPFNRGCIPKFWGQRAMGRSRLQRDLPGSLEYLRGGQDCANLGRIPLARRPPGTGHQTPAWPMRRLAQSDFTPTTGPISDATVVVPRVLCLGGPYAGLHRSRLAQSAPVGVLFGALVMS